MIQKSEIEQIDVDAQHEGFKPLKFTSILQKLPELLNQTHTVVSVYAKDDVEYMPQKKFRCPSRDKLMDDIADVLGTCAQILLRNTYE